MNFPTQKPVLDFNLGLERMVYYYSMEALAAFFPAIILVFNWEFQPKID
jgi:hypothetical protein